MSMTSKNFMPTLSHKRRSSAFPNYGNYHQKADRILHDGLLFRRSVESSTSTSTSRAVPSNVILRPHYGESQTAALTSQSLLKTTELKLSTIKTSLPRDIHPQLATAAKSPPLGDEWLHEIKFDGYRILAFKQGSSVRLVSRNDLDWTRQFAHVAAALQYLPGDAVLDGEVVVLDEHGRCSFQALQRAVKGQKSSELVYFVFDLLWLNGRDLRGVPLIERKEILRDLLESLVLEKAVVRFSDYLIGKGDRFFQGICELGVEGMVSKKAQSRYVGRRSRDWVKVKCRQQQDFVIGGFTPSRAGFGSLLLGFYDQSGNLHYAGDVGSGFTDLTLGSLHRSMLELQIPTSPFFNWPPKKLSGAFTWVEPQLVGRIEFMEWTDDGRLRAPAFKGLSQGKDPGDVRRGESDIGLDEPPPASIPAARKMKSGTMEVAGITITHPDRMFPEVGVTKGQVAEYFRDVAPLLLPFIADRPLSVVRGPEGWEKASFYQKHHTAGMPESVGSVRVTKKSGEKVYLSVDSMEGLVALAQFGVLEIHPWLSRNGSPDKPDMMIFDLDPGENIAFEEVLGAAFLLRDVLWKIGLESFPKLTGGKGLHVVVPLNPELSFSVIKPAAKAIAERVRGFNPGRFLLSSSKAKRPGKIYLDYLRNGQGATAIAPYSVRARAGTPVSVPIGWDEIRPGLRPDAYSIKNLPKHATGRNGDPWKGFFELKQALTKSALRDLGMKEA